MKTSLASITVALSLGLLAVAQPAIAQPRWEARASATIERFTLRTPSERIRSGDELHLRLAGSPHGQAWVDIPGVVSRLALAESRPGVYEGTYVVRRRDDAAAFPRAVATLRAGREQVSARVDVREERDAGRDRDRDRGDRDRDRDGDRDRGDSRRDGDQRQPDRDRRGGAAIPVPTPPRPPAPAPRPRVATPAPVVPAGPLTLRITSHANNAVVNVADNVSLQGVTAPHATLHVQVDSLMNTSPPSLRRIVDRTFEAGADGRFSVDTAPSGFVLPGLRYDVRITATLGNKSVEERLTLQRR
jgi:hypothetical protein